MLIADSIGHFYQSGHWLFRGLSFSLEKGQWLGIQGRSGSGKTTLGSLLSGYASPIEGSVTLHGQPVASITTEQAAPVQRLFQHPEVAMNPLWQAGRMINEGAAVSGELLSLFDIQPDWLSRYPHQLSGGQLARLALVRALAVEPDYLIADEITASLDTINQAALWQGLKAVANRKGMGVLVISHNHSLLGQLCAETLSL